MQSFGFCDRLRQPCRWEKKEKGSFDRWSGVLNWRRGCCHLFAIPLSSKCRGWILRQIAATVQVRKERKAALTVEAESWVRGAVAAICLQDLWVLNAELRILRQIAATVQVRKERKRQLWPLKRSPKLEAQLLPSVCKTFEFEMQRLDFATDCGNRAGEKRKKGSFDRWSGVLS